MELILLNKINILADGKKFEILGVDIAEAITEGIKTAWNGVWTAAAKWIVGNSYNICFTVAIVALFLNMAGVKKASKAIPISLVTYFILQALGMLL